MITVATEKTFTTSDGTKHYLLREAIRCELEMLIKKTGPLDPKANPEAAIVFDTMIKTLIDQAPLVVDILTMTENAKPKARAIHGGRKPRKKAVEAAAPAAQTSN